MKPGDRAIYNGEPMLENITKRYGGDTCTILEVREKFGDCRVAFDSFPNTNHRDYHNRFMVSMDSLTKI